VKIIGCWIDEFGVDAGADLSSFGLVVDINGTALPQGCCYDIGAYEYGSSLSVTTASNQVQ
jgi:hypothetical protein